MDVTRDADYLVPVRKWLFSPISLLDEKNYPRNIKYMPAAIFFVRLDLEKNSSFLDRHYLNAPKADAGTRLRS